MKKKDIKIRFFLKEDSRIEKLIQKRHGELMQLAIKNGEFFGRQNKPQLHGSITSCTSELKYGFERLWTDITVMLLPDAQLPQAKIDAAHIGSRKDTIISRINDIRHENDNARYKAGDENFKLISKRKRQALLLTTIIVIGETIYNAKALQIFGDSKLLSLLLAVSISIAISAFAHFTILLFKEVQPKLYKWTVIITSILISLVVFIVLGEYRSQYLAKHDIKICPLYFIVFNMFFYLLSGAISYFFLPNWSELKQNFKLQHQLQEIKKRESEKMKLEKELLTVADTAYEESTNLNHVIHLAKNLGERIRKMYKECLAAFVRSNIAHRNDGTPDAFNQEPEDININDDWSHLLNGQRNENR